ncbi:MAG: GatB/YqeY domain-containing protein [Firmicutes bacterium]|nr:GatB/YqeY domain-containing protein [Bacillota bacterium]
MSLQEKLQEDLKAAMKSKDSRRLSVIRLAKAAIKNTEIAKKKELGDDEVLEVLNREVKQRRDAIPEFQKGNRPDLVESLEAEIAILMEYLPQQMSEEEIRQAAKEAVAAVGAKDARDMGKVMGALMPKVRGKADGRLVNQVVKELLQ